MQQFNISKIQNVLFYENANWYDDCPRHWLQINKLFIGLKLTKRHHIFI